MVRVRIAPSPTGNCHVGTARTALFNLLLARQQGGTMILRIDDTDRRRSTQESEEGVLSGLRWLGLTWDEGPGVGGEYGPYWQSERIEIYRGYAQELVDRGLAYPCYCSEAELAAARAAQQETPGYSGRCAHLSAAERAAMATSNPNPTIRLRVPDSGDLTFDDLIRGPITVSASGIGDFVIIKSDGMPTYNFATVIDEHLMAITHVLRGQEHISNTFPQLAIYQALGWAPPAFGHLNLMLNPDKTKISKRKNAVFIGEFAAMGFLPEALINFLALQGWSPGDDREVFSFDELVAAFAVERCTPANAVFDMQKLEWLNGVHIRRLPADDLARRLAPFLEGAGLMTTPDKLTGLVALIQERINRLDEAPALVDFLFRAPTTFEAEPDRAACAAARDRLAALAEWTPAAIDQALRILAADLGQKPRELFGAVRMAVSGRKVTPPLFESLALLGREETLARLEASV